MIAGAGHIPQAEQLDRTTEVVTAFLKERDGTA